jgi:phosphoglycolate phosphatase
MTLNVFLDLDGTLTDPSLGSSRCIAYPLKQLGLPVLTREELNWTIGPSLLDSFARMGVDDPDQAQTIYRERYGDVGLFENEIYAGIPEMLKGLRSSGATLYLATAKSHVYARRITAHFGLSGYFDDEFGPELDGTRNDKGELLKYSLEKTGHLARDSVMVGDRMHDISAAQAVGMRSVAVSWGFGSQDEWAKADAVCRRPSDLADCIGRLKA